MGVSVPEKESEGDDDDDDDDDDEMSINEMMEDLNENTDDDFLEAIFGDQDSLFSDADRDENEADDNEMSTDFLHGLLGNKGYQTFKSGKTSQFGSNKYLG